MTSDSLLLQEHQGRVVRLRLNRPEKRNAINSALIAEATERVQRLAGEIEPLVVVLSGAGSAFSAGADVQELRAFDEDSARDFITRLHRLIDAMRALPQVVIASVRGPCLGGALELAAACDLRIASQTARFAMPEVRVGVPSVIEAALLAPLMGLGRAADLVLSGDTLDAAAAERAGLVTRVVADADLDAATDALATQIASFSGPAVRAQKALIGTWPSADVSASVRASIDAFAAAYRTPNPAEAITAMLERRPARFTER